MTWTRHDWQTLILAAAQYALDHPEGFTKAQLGAELGTDPEITNGVVYRLRRRLADQNVNLVARPQHKFEPWLYSLVGEMGDAALWENIRFRDISERLRTVKAVASSMLNAAPDEAERDARLIVRDVERLIEDVELIQNRTAYA